MLLEPGTGLGPYEVLERIGGRGMGSAARSQTPSYTRPWSIIASATLRNPAMLAPFT
jgi:hypothetical protein